MRVKKSDVFKIIQEELEAVKRAMPAWLEEEVTDEQVFWEQDYNAGFEGARPMDSKSIAYQLGTFDREQGNEHNPSEDPPRGPDPKNPLKSPPTDDMGYTAADRAAVEKFKLADRQAGRVREAEQDFAADALSPNDIRFMLEKTWKRIEDKSARQGGGIDPHQMEASDAIDMVLDEANPKMDWVIQFLHMDSSQQENMMQNAMGQVHGSVPVVSTQGTAGKVRDPAEGLREDEDEGDEKKEKPIPAYNPDTRRQQLQKRNPGRKYSLEEDAAYDALVELGKFQAKLANEGYDELANELDQVIVQMQDAGLTQGHDQKGLDEAALQLEPGMQVKNTDTDQVGTVQSVKAGAGVVIKLDDGTIEEWETSILEPVGDVEEIMIGDREVPKFEWPADYPSPDEFAQLSSGEQQEIFDRALADYKENWRDMDPREEEMFKERFALYKSAMEADHYTEASEADPYKQGDPSVQDSWSPDDLIAFLKKGASFGEEFKGGVTAKEMVYAFGGQWQTHAAKLQKMVDQGQLAKQGNRYVLTDVNETLRDIFGFNTLGEEADQAGGKEEVLRRIVADGQAAEVDGVLVDPKSASIIVKVLDEIDDSNKEKLLAIDPGSMAEFAMKIGAIQERFQFNELEEEFTPEEEEALVKAMNKEEDEVRERLRSKAMLALREKYRGDEKYQSHRDIPQKDVDAVISFLKDQRAAEIGELDLGSIMQDMGMELNTVKLIMVDRLGYNIEPSESDPRGKIFFDRPVGASRPEPGENTMSEAGIGNIEVGDHVDVMGSAIAGAAGEVLELTKTTQGDPALVVRLTKAASSKLYGGIGDEVIVKPDFVELSALPGDKRPQPGDDDQGEYAMHYTEAATNKLREHVGRFMKVTLREEARRK